MIESFDDTVEISEGVEMPRLGFGTYKAAEGDEVTGAVRTALEVGYRSIDTASFYGNEAGVGKGIRQSGVPREEVFVASKVWNTEQGFSETRAALERSLARLKMSYVDLYLVHWPIPTLMFDTWKAMERALAEGITRAIGVCNFLPHHLNALMARADVPPSVDQLEFHPRLQQPDVVAFCLDNGITVEAWAPIMRGNVAEIEEIGAIASRHGKTPAQVTLRWILQRGIVAIPKSVHADRIAANADIFDFELSLAEMATMDGLDTGDRIGPSPDHPPI